MIFQHVILGLISIALGVAGLKYNFQLVGFTGHIGWIEDHLGYGSTYIFFKIASVILCIGGFLYIFGLLDPILHWVFSPLTQLFTLGGGQ